jgi:hypothetical protein
MKSVFFEQKEEIMKLKKKSILWKVKWGLCSMSLKNAVNFRGA